MNRLISIVFAAIAVAATVFPAHALNPVDDFEIGTFSLWTARNNNCAFDTLLLSWYEPHVISQVRSVMVCGIGDHTSTAYLDAGSQIDDMVRFFPGGNETDFLRIKYNWGFPRTLTYGGALNRIEVDLRQGVPGGTLAIAIGDAGGSDFVVRDATGPGLISIPLSEFTGVDVNLAMWMQVSLASSYAVGVFELADIRLRGDGHWGPATTVNFEGDFVAIEVPPVPSPPLSFRMTDPEGNRLYRTNLSITLADGGVINPCFRAEFADAAGLGGEIGGMIFMGIEPTPFIDTDFEFAVDLEPSGRLAPIPEIVGSPSLTSSPFGFLITFPVRLTDPSGNEIGRSETRVLFDVHEGQALKLEGVQVTPGSAPKGTTAAGFRIGFAMEVLGDLDPDAPLFEATWIADWSPQNVTAVGGPVPAGSPANGSIALTAWPSVTREGTEIRASLPVEVEATVVILDVSGRVVRELAMARGVPAVRWDGRDGRGAPTGSGLYFARLAGAGQDSRPARILRLR